MTTDRPHGTPASYRRGCRCSDCRAANAKYHREQRAKRKQRNVLASFEHGAGGYNNWGCRCETCTTAWREANRPYVKRYQATHRDEINHRSRKRADAEQGRSLEQATRFNRQWTEVEMALVRRTDLTVAQIAEMTGRTFWAVQTTRRRLKLEPEAVGRKYPTGRERLAEGRRMSREELREYDRKYRQEHPELAVKVAAYKRRIDNELLDQAVNRGKEWTGPELEIASREDLSSVQAARMLHRTREGVKWARSQLDSKDPRKRMLRDGPQAS